MKTISTTKHLLIFSLIQLYLIMHSSAAVIGVPGTPQEMIQKADFIAVGNLTEDPNGVFLLKVEKVIKGASQAKGKSLPFIPDTTEGMSMTYINKLIDGKSTIFVGSITDKNILIPKYAYSSFWPQGMALSPRYPDFKTLNLEGAQLLLENLIKSGLDSGSVSTENSNE